MLTATESKTSPATVVRVHPLQRTLCAHFASDAAVNIEARVALAHPVALQCGDTVLVTGSEDAGWYVIGVLEQARQAGSTSPDPHKDRVETSEQNGHATQCVFSRDGELLLEYDATARRTRVHLHPGDVEFVSHDGEIHLAAERGIRLESGGHIQFDGKQGVHITSEQSSLSLSSCVAKLAGPHIGIKTPSLDVQAARSRFTGRRLLARIGLVRFISETLETVFGNVVQKATNVFRRISGIEELHAKHVRTLVEESQHVKAGTINVKADGDVRIDGEQIHLG